MRPINSQIETSAELPGALVAAVLAGAWRCPPPPPEITAQELKAIAPLLLESGAAALGWWRLRHSDLRASPAAVQLQQAYRLHTLQAGLHERDIQEVLPLLYSAGIEPLLVKGWAIARLYPEPGLRPYGDIDLCVRPEQYRAAQGVLKGPEGRKYYVDLHRGSEKLDGCGFDELFARSRAVRLGSVEVRVLAPEDELRILCLHLLRHGAWRPLWLCDIAVALESRPADFDWDRCLGWNQRRADWVACTLGLAHQLLGAKVDGTPAAERAERLPSWFVPAALKQWELRRRTRGVVEVATAIRDPIKLLKDFHHHWPNAIEGTVGTGGPFNELPRLPFQLGDFLWRAAKALAQIPN